MGLRPDLTIYRNHLGEELRFGEFGLYIDSNTLRNYSWETQYRGDRISRFERKPVTKSLDFLVADKSHFVDRTELKDTVFEVVEKDVLAKKYGKLIIGDYYLNCFITASEKNNFDDNPTLTSFSFEITTDRPYWVREQLFSLYPRRYDDQGLLDYPYDFPYDYAKDNGLQYVENDSFAECSFRMIICGAASNPSVFVNGHLYKVNATVAEGEYLTIDSTEKTIVLTRNDGTKVNVFDNRERSSYIFEPIPSGNNAVTWTGDFGIDITLIEERSEPKWT